jgi:2,3-diketo-5-methylthio-1-phosphopentane phosphatase
LDAYLSDIKIDPYFSRIVKLLRGMNIKPVIISDDFRFIVKTILDNNGIKGLKLNINELKFKGDKLSVYFPHRHSLCPKCGNCKTAHLVNKKRDSGVQKVYVGDGLSDVCPAEFCEIVFAKGSLLKHFRDIKRKCVPFNDLSVVYKFFSSMEVKK